MLLFWSNQKAISNAFLAAIQVRTKLFDLTKIVTFAWHLTGSRYSHAPTYSHTPKRTMHSIKVISSVDRPVFSCHSKLVLHTDDGVTHRNVYNNYCDQILSLPHGLFVVFCIYNEGKE